MEDKKNYFKKNNLPGVDLTMLDISTFASVKIQRTFVTKPMYKVGSKTYIGLKEALEDGDIIQVGKLGLKYTILALKTLTPREGRIHRVKRYDGNSTTSTDIDAIKVGQKVHIVNRRSFDDIFNSYPHNNYNCDFDELSGICPDDRCANK